ncbi:MAG: hypothetical protein WA581_13765 [Candidatus Acidiferrales bacterium]
MTPDPKNLSPELRAIDSQASVLMKRGISLLAVTQSNSTVEALALFDSALELRRRLPIETVPQFGYGLAACWLNRAEALMQLREANADHIRAVLRAYDEAILLLRKLPLDEDMRFPRRLAIAYQNLGLTLQTENRSDIAEVSATYLEAIAVLDHDQSAPIPDRRYLLGTVWLNLANAYVSVPDAKFVTMAQNAARCAISLVSDLEVSNVGAAEVGLKARHVLCQTLALLLSQAIMNGEANLDSVHEATDAADDGLDLARHWEEKGVVCFRNMACDLFGFGARVYATFQPQFLDEFVRDSLDLVQSSPKYATWLYR